MLGQTYRTIGNQKIECMMAMVIGIVIAAGFSFGLSLFSSGFSLGFG